MHARQAQIADFPYKLVVFGEEEYIAGLDVSMYDLYSEVIVFPGTSMRQPGSAPVHVETRRQRRHRARGVVQ